MSIVWIRMALVILALAAVIATGIWMRLSGRPYSACLFTVHKTITVSLIVLLAVNAFKVDKWVGLMPPGRVVPVAAIVVLLGMVVSGGWMGATESYPQILSSLHRLLAYLAVPVAAVAFYLLWVIGARP